MTFSRSQVLVFLLLILTVAAGFSQRDQGGFIAPADSLSKLLPNEQIILLPQDGFTFYEVPNGEFKGKILSGPPLNSHSTGTDIDTLMTATITGVNIRPQLLPLDVFFQTYDDCYHLTFNLQTDNHVFVLQDSYQGWISIADIKKKGFQLVSWMEFYGEVKGRKIHPSEKISAIRMGPSTEAKIIETADELYSEISSTGKCEGTFCLVKVIQYKNPYDQAKSKEENILKKYRGWIRIIDDEGKPLVAHNSHGG